MALISRRDAGKLLLAGGAGTLVPARGLPRAEMINAVFNSVTGVISARAATTYYISQSSGNDSNDGKSPSTAWKTLARASQPTYAPGDKTLLKCGDTWDEELHPKGDGAAATPIWISSYGSGRRPIIDRHDDGFAGNNMDKICIHLQNIAGYKITAIEFARCGRGVFVDYDSRQSGKDYIHVEDCYFHDMAYHDESGNGRTKYIWNSGVDVRVGNESNVIVLSNITVKGCRFERVVCGVNTWVGIETSGIEWDRKANDIYQFHNVVVEDCTAYDGHNWQFAIRSTKGGKLVHCSVHKTLYYDENVQVGSASTLLFRNRDLTVENCEFGYQRIGRCGFDGESFDIEGNNRNITLRNCLFHDSEGPLFLFCDSSTVKNDDVRFHNCVFARGGGRTFLGYATHTTFEACRFYHGEHEQMGADAHLMSTFSNCTVRQVSDRGNDGLNLASAAQVSASSSVPGHEPSGAIDGKAATGWKAASSTDQWLQLDFGHPQTINKFRIKEDPPSSVVRYVIECWDDKAEKWIGCFNGLTIGADFIAPIVSRTTSKVRLLIKETSSGDPEIAEFEAYNERS